MKITSRNKARKISFQHGGAFSGGTAVSSAIPPTDPNGKPQKSIRVLGSAPLIPQSELPYTMSKYRSLLTENQVNDLDLFKQTAVQEDFSSDEFYIGFSDKIRDFGLDPDLIRDQTFINEFNRTRTGFEKNFPGGVRFEAAHGPD